MTSSPGAGSPTRQPLPPTALTLWSNMVKNGSAVLTQGYASQTDFANGTSSILIGTTGFYPYLDQAAASKFPIGEASLPADNVSATSLFGGYLGMFFPRPRRPSKARLLPSSSA